MAKEELDSLPPAAIVAVLELIQKYPKLTNFYPMFLVDSAREGETRHAYIKILVPDEVVKNMRGEPKKRDNYCLVRLKRDIEQYENSGLIIPSGPGSRDTEFFGV